MSGFEGGSFRDPAGRVFISEGRVFRSIMPIAHDAFRTVSSNSFVRELIEAGRLIGFDELSPETASSVYRGRGPAPAAVLEHPRIEVISYPYEWPFLMLKAAALHHLDLHLDLLKNNLTLIDATAYNVQFRGPNPIFIDLLSLRPYVPGTLWTGHQQFCDQFLNPLLLRSLVGISHNAWYRGSPEGIPTAALAPAAQIEAQIRLEGVGECDPSRQATAVCRGAYGCPDDGKGQPPAAATRGICVDADEPSTLDRKARAAQQRPLDLGRLRGRQLLFQ